MRVSQTMAKTKAKYLVDGKGRKTAVQLDIATYRALLGEIEDLRDALQLDETVRSASTSRPYDKIRAGLRQSGRL